MKGSNSFLYPDKKEPRVGPAIKPIPNIVINLANFGVLSSSEVRSLGMHMERRKGDPKLKKSSTKGVGKRKNNLTYA